KKDGAQLLLVCGSVGDGKSHIISYFKDKYPDEMGKFNLHNDATESLEPDKTSMDTLNDVLDNFSDDKIETSNEKFILAINLGTLNNFIDSQYGERFTKLKQFVIDKKILEPGIEDNEFDPQSPFQFIDFSDYHLFTLRDGKVKSDYVKSLINKITDENGNNEFFNSYKRNCGDCAQCSKCPIKSNYELLKKVEVQEAIISLLVQSVIKHKIIISTRALLNFIYEILVARSYIDVNSPSFKTKIGKLTNQEYIKSLTPNILFSHKELSFIFDSISKLDPLNVRNEKVDDFIIKFNNSSNVMGFFKSHIDFPFGYLNKVGEVNFDETQDKNLRYELLKLFIRSYSLCGVGDLFELKDKEYEKFMNYVYLWNKGDKSLRKSLYTDVKNGIMKWNGEADKNQINIFIGQNQVKYKASEEIDFKMDISNLPDSDEVELKKFLTTLEVKFKNEKTNDSYGIDVDFSLYELLIKVTKGYRPNKNDKNHFIKFIEFINKIESTGSQKESIIITEKNRQENKKYKLEFNEEYEEYRFVEM
ncbi:MAG: DNA phosphorothioation-dependent restriction protein DptF, partial [Clostridium sp.]